MDQPDTNEMKKEVLLWPDGCRKSLSPGSRFERHALPRCLCVFEIVPNDEKRERELEREIGLELKLVCVAEALFCDDKE